MSWPFPILEADGSDGGEELAPWSYLARRKAMVCSITDVECVDKKPC